MCTSRHMASADPERRLINSACGSSSEMPIDSIVQVSNPCASSRWATECGASTQAEDLDIHDGNHLRCALLEDGLVDDVPDVLAELPEQGSLTSAQA